MEPFHCTCLGEIQPTANGSRWELPTELRTAGCITTTAMDLRNQTFAPGERQMRLKSCACINTTELLVPPEVSVTNSGCAGCISNVKMVDRRPVELRGSRPDPKGVVRVGGCACINTTAATTLEHGQPLPKGFFHWLLGGDHYARRPA